MKKLAWSFFLVLFMNASVHGQNMFNNGGFEEYISCPTTTDETNLIVGCIGNFMTPEYYNCTFQPGAANNGTGSVYLGSIRQLGGSVTEGITLELTTPLTVGQEYTISISSNYGVSVYGDSNFDYSQIRKCFNLKFLFSMGNVIGDPTAPHHEIDAESVVGNGNTEYEDFSFSYTPDQNYTHLYIITGGTSTNTESSPDPNCLSNGPTAYVYYNIIDDLIIEPVISHVGIEELVKEEKKLIKIVDLMGRETYAQKNMVLIYQYSDGTAERVFELE